MIYFGFGFSWFGETAGALVGPFAPVLVLGPAAIEAPAFAAVALVTSLAARRVHPALVPLASASAYAAIEAVRSSGTFGLPFSQLGVAMIDSPLRVLAAVAGGYGITFATVLLGASLGWWLLAREDRARGIACAAAWLGVGCAAALGWTLWPARHAPPPARRVAAVQGGIAQTVKRSDTGLPLAIDRYVRMTASLRDAHPSLVLWPETVITEDLAQDPVTSARFDALARSLHTTLYVGTLVRVPGSDGYNALRVYGRSAAPYEKEQLVPFVEYLPAPGWLRRVPPAAEISDFLPGHNAVETIDGATALICWESLFSDIAHARVARGASLLLIATDDAWFGTTQGPYEHAQAATLRAVETGRWVLRAGATGISGIVAPDGTWTRQTALGGPALVVGDVGAPAPTLFAMLGPAPVVATLTVLAVLPFLGRRR